MRDYVPIIAFSYRLSDKWWIVCPNCEPVDKKVEPIFFGEKSDFPVHCNECGEFIEEFTLTEDGEKHVVYAFAKKIITGEGSISKLRAWLRLFYRDRYINTIDTLGKLIEEAERNNKNENQ